MKKIASQIIVLSLLLASYCPSVFGEFHMNMEMDMSTRHTNESNYFHQNTNDNVDCCDEGMPELTIGNLHLPNEIKNGHLATPLPTTTTSATEPQHWNLFSNNLSPPHLQLIGVTVSLE